MSFSIPSVPQLKTRNQEVYGATQATARRGSLPTASLAIASEPGPIYIGSLTRAQKSLASMIYARSSPRYGRPAAIVSSVSGEMKEGIRHVFQG